MEETRRGRKHARHESEGGYYADPLSPIASTPMKRPRTKPANTKSAKSKHVGAASTARTIVERDEDRRFFSPRKLAKEYDDVDGDEGDASLAENETPKNVAKSELPESTATTSNGASTEQSAPNPVAKADNAPDTDGVMFSPLLKIPRTVRTPSGGNSPTGDSRNRADSAGSSPDSSTSVSPEKNGDNVRPNSESQVDRDENSLVNEETDKTNDEAGDTEFNPFVFIKSLPKYDELVPTAREAVLPAKTKHSPDLCLVLDLDETLVHCTVDHVENPHLQFPVNFNGVDYTVNVKKRPHMEYFLKQVSKRFEVVVFTASHRAYAEKLLNLIDPRRELIKYRLYREDCLDVYGNYLKDLNVLGRHLSKVVLVDNSPHAFGYQVNNGIPIETWYDDPGDDELLNLLPFLESLIDAEDVRPIVEKQFQIQKLIDSLPDELI